MPRLSGRLATSTVGAAIANNLGDLLRLQDNLDEAIEQYERSLAIFEQQARSTQPACCDHEPGRDLPAARRPRQGREPSAPVAPSYSSRLGAEDFLPELDRYLAELHLRRGDLSRQAGLRDVLG